MVGENGYFLTQKKGKITKNRVKLRQFDGCAKKKTEIYQVCCAADFFFCLFYAKNATGAEKSAAKCGKTEKVREVKQLPQIPAAALYSSESDSLG